MEAFDPDAPVVDVESIEDVFDAFTVRTAIECIEGHRHSGTWGAKTKKLQATWYVFCVRS